MLASRARRKVQATERPTVVGREQREVVQAFLAAARCGDFEGLLRVLMSQQRREMMASLSPQQPASMQQAREEATSRFSPEELAEMHRRRSAMLPD